MLIIGQLNINHKEKTEFFIVSSVTYNSFMGYALITIYNLAKLYISDTPKGQLRRIYYAIIGNMVQCIYWLISCCNVFCVFNSNKYIYV